MRDNDTAGLGCQDERGGSVECQERAHDGEVPASPPASASEGSAGSSVTKSAGRPVGFASYSTIAPGVSKLHKIYVHQNTQGQGIGKQLIDHIISDLRSRSIHTLRLNVNRYNKARSFYEKLGFIVVKEEDIDIGSGYFMIDFVMEKKLTN